jgi:hypothetical protein
MAIKLPLPVNFGPGGRAYRHIEFGCGPRRGCLAKSLMVLEASIRPEDFGIEGLA